MRPPAICLLCEQPILRDDQEMRPSRVFVAEVKAYRQRTIASLHRTCWDEAVMAIRAAKRASRLARQLVSA